MANNKLGMFWWFTHTFFSLATLRPALERDEAWIGSEG
jgi:hypothetical protein